MLLYYIQQGELFDLSPATPLLNTTIVLGDRRTYAVYDLTKAETFGQLRSLNLLIRWKGEGGKHLFTNASLRVYLLAANFRHVVWLWPFK